MARVVRLNAPDSIRLTEMPKEEIERYVADLAQRGIELAGDNRVIGVNAVSLGQLSDDVGVWAEWTRSCCGSRQLIDDYVDPTPEDYGIAAGVLPEALADAHLESQMHVIQLQGEDHVAE